MTTTTAEPAESRRIGWRHVAHAAVEQAPCRAIVPVAHYVYPYLTPQRTIVFSCAGVADSAPTPDGAAWEALFLEV